MTTDSTNRESLQQAGYAYVPYDEALRPPGSSVPTLGLAVRDAPEFANNREERCPIVLVLDTSSSMNGKPIAELNEAVRTFHKDLSADPLVESKVDVAVIQFNNVINFEDFVNGTSFHPPNLSANGGTIFSFPLVVALDMITKRKDTYRLNGISYHRPWIVFITDGHPEHDTEDAIDDIGRRLREAEGRRECSLFVITCGQANEAHTTNLLRDRIANPSRPPKKTKEENFKELFNWLSNSMAAVSQSSPDEQVRLPDTSGWEIV